MRRGAGGSRSRTFVPPRPFEEGGGGTSSGGAAAAAGPRTRSHYDPTHQVPAPAPGVCASSQAGGSGASTSTGLAETSGTAASVTACEAPQAEAPVVVGVPLSACSQALRRSPRLHKRPQPQTEQTQTQPPTQTEQPQPPQRALRPLQLPPDRPAFSPPGRRPGSGLGGHGLRIVERWTDPWPYVVLCAVAIFCATYVAVSGTRCTNLNFQIWQPGAPRTYHLPTPHPSAPHRPRNCHNHLCALCADCSSMTRPHTLLSCLHFRVSCEARLSPSATLA